MMYVCRKRTHGAGFGFSSLRQVSRFGLVRSVIQVQFVRFILMKNRVRVRCVQFGFCSIPISSSTPDTEKCVPMSKHGNCTHWGRRPCHKYAIIRMLSGGIIVSGSSRYIHQVIISWILKIEIRYIHIIKWQWIAGSASNLLRDLLETTSRRFGLTWNSLETIQGQAMWNYNKLCACNFSDNLFLDLDVFFCCSLVLRVLGARKRTRRWNILRANRFGTRRRRKSAAATRAEQ